MEKEQRKKDAEKAFESLSHGGEPDVKDLMKSLQAASMENQRLKMQLSQVVEQFKDLQLRLGAEEYKVRMEYLWKVVTSKEGLAFDEEFVERCRAEFQNMIFPPAGEEEEDDA